MDNRGNSRANTCAKTRLLGRVVFGRKTFGTPEEWQRAKAREAAKRYRPVPQNCRTHARDPRSAICFMCLIVKRETTAIRT